MSLVRALLGITFFVLVAWLLSSERKRMPWRIVLVGIGVQLALAWFILRTDVGRRTFEGLGAFASKLIAMTDEGTGMVFGELANPAGPVGMSFAFAALPTIIFFSALMALLYHLGVMQFVVWVLAKIMSKLLGVSGAESMSMAANVFCGQTEAPLVVRPYIAGMTSSELMALMTGGFATIAGSVLAVYIGILGEEFAPHLLTASVMSAPAAFVMAKVMLPETAVPQTAGRVELKVERDAHNLVEAAANGTLVGLKLWLNVIAMLIAFKALIALVDWPLGALGEWFAIDGGLSLVRLFGWVFGPVAWLMGVEGWHDCQIFGSLLGTKIAVNEFVAYDQLGGVRPGAASDLVFESARSAKMAAYALCGFANFSSIGIQLGGITPLAPGRKTELSRLAFRAMLGGAFASWMTATIAAPFL